MLSGSVYASNLFATTDSSPGTSNAFGFFDDLSIAAVSTELKSDRKGI
jgi:hypothetical protein